MKKRISILIAIALLAVILSTLLVACNNTEYSVTVLSPDGNPVADVTVNWLNGNKVAGTAKTGEDGIATIKLAAGSYNISLEGFGEGFEYTSISVTSAMPKINIDLEVKRVTYTVTVKDKDGANAQGVTVTWMKGASLAGTATTGADGKATKELDYGDYSVALNNLPDGNVFDGAKTVTGANPSTEFNLSGGNTKRHSVVVKSEGGLLFKNQTVNVYIKGEDMPLMAGNTNDEGVFSFTVKDGEYTVAATELPDGYTQVGDVNLSASNTTGEIILRSEIITTEPAANTTYVLGDIFHNYEFTTPYNIKDTGKPWSGSIAEILKTKQAIILNNWGTGCTYCVQEMPAMQNLYEKYSDQIEIIAVNNYISNGGRDSDSDIINYYANNGYTFPMMRDVYNFAVKFDIQGWPHTIIIDRYGAIARIESGAIPSDEAWEYMILKYIGDDYVQTFEPGDKTSPPIVSELAKPDITVPDDHYEKVEEALNVTSTFDGATVTWRGETNDEMAWPFLLGTVEGVSPDQPVIYASNVGKGSSYAIIYADVDVSAGKLFTFDYYVDCEDLDIFYIFWDGKVVREISGNNADRGWQTCYCYVDITSGEHEFAIVYMKDESANEGLDNMYVRNVRFTEFSNLDNHPTDMLRNAAYGTLNEGDTQFPYYAQVKLGSDGYYHVVLNSLQNSQYAGVDDSPMLFVNLGTVTPWNTQYSLTTLIGGVDEYGDYVFNCTFTVDGVRRDYRKDLIEYTSAASASDLPGFVPVNKKLHDMLVAFMPQISGNRSHDNEWLEACYFYSHYGSDEYIGNPIVGLMRETAIPLVLGERVEANLTRIMAPFPTEIYSFTPNESGLYKLESFIPDEIAQQYAAQVWLYDDNTDPDHALAYSGSERLNRDAKNEQNFELYYNMEAGHKYYIEVSFLMTQMGRYEFCITRQTEDVTLWMPAAADTYIAILDENDKIIDSILAGAVDYELYTDGYYRVKNADGSWGDYLYLDVINVNTITLAKPFDFLVDQNVQSPLVDADGKYQFLDYKYFDFRYCAMYYKLNDGNDTDAYIPKVNISENNPTKYQDYTAKMKEYIESAPTSGEYKGLVKVDEELANILRIFLELRVNSVWAKVENGIIIEWESENVHDNEWLMFCWYQKTYYANTNNNETTEEETL